MIYYYHGTPNEVLEHLLEEAEEKSSILEISQNDKAIQVKCVDPTGKIIVDLILKENLK